MKLAVPLLVVGIVANLVESTTVSYTFHNGAIEVICVQENAPARFLSDLCQTVFFIEPLEYFLAVRVHMRVYCQRHPTVRIPAKIGRAPELQSHVNLVC